MAGTSLWVSVAGGDWCWLVVKLENYALALAAPLAQAYSFSILPAYMFILHQRKGCNPPKQEVHPCLTRFTTVVIHPVHYIHYKRVQTLTSLCWKPEGTICIIHHMFSTCFETRASWVLAHRTHQSPQSPRRNTQSPSSPLSHAGPLGTRWKFWKIF